MKKKILKLFLLLGVIILSLTVFASCEDEYENLIEDKEKIEFIIKSYPTYVTRPILQMSAIVAPKMHLAYLYEASNKDPSLNIKEYSLSNETKMIACYAPQKSVEKIFDLTVEDYLQNWCNTYAFSYVREYMQKNELTYQDVGLKFCYIDEDNLKSIKGKDVLVYLGQEIKAHSVDGNVEVYYPYTFETKEKNKPKILSDSSEYMGKKYLRLSDFEEKFLSISDLHASRSVPVENESGIEIVRESISAYAISEDALKSYLEMLESALISREEKLFIDGQVSAYLYTYDYQKLKEIMKIY